MRTPHNAIVVGLMSGTSLDGISAAVVQFVENKQDDISAQLLAYAHRPYSSAERSRLEAAMHDGSAREYCRLSVDLGEWLADAATAVLGECAVTRRDVLCIASHGQTLWHEPGHSTWQVGDAATIAERVGIPVVYDFRTRDMAAGGQGAPLVPIADSVLFAHETEWRALQNIGGIANVTVVPPRTMRQTAFDGVRAFDTGPGMVLVDTIARTLWPAEPFDRDGRLSQGGGVVQSVVDEVLAHAYFREMPPKSTGRELFTRDFASHVVSACRAEGADDRDVLATTIRITARSIADQYRRFVPEPVSSCIVSGGGARNPTLLGALREELPASIDIARFDDLYFDGEAKEAVAFALLGYLRMTNRPANVPGATGARGPRILGAVVAA